MYHPRMRKLQVEALLRGALSVICIISCNSHLCDRKARYRFPDERIQAQTGPVICQKQNSNLPLSGLPLTFKACSAIYGIFLFSINVCSYTLDMPGKPLQGLCSLLLPTCTLSLVFSFSFPGNPFHMIYFPLKCGLLLLGHLLRHLSHTV